MGGFWGPGICSPLSLGPGAWPSPPPPGTSSRHRVRDTARGLCPGKERRWRERRPRRRGAVPTPPRADPSADVRTCVPPSPSAERCRAPALVQPELRHSHGPCPRRLRFSCGRQTRRGSGAPHALHLRGGSVPGESGQGRRGQCGCRGGGLRRGDPQEGGAAIEMLPRREPGAGHGRVRTVALRPGETGMPGGGGGHRRGRSWGQGPQGCPRRSLA